MDYDSPDGGYSDNDEPTQAEIAEDKFDNREK